LDIPYYAVIFSAHRTPGDNGYNAMAVRMEAIAATMPGYLGLESARNEDGFGITVSYWKTEDDIANWKQQVDHLEAQRQGHINWYKDFDVRVAKVERAYNMKKN